MPRTSNRVKNAYESPIRKLAPSADKAEAQGKKIYYLNIGQPDIKTPKAALAAVQNASIDILKYAPAKGILSYREKLVPYYQKYNPAIDVEDILVTNGASEAILFLMLSCLDAKDEVLIPEPLYANYIGFSEVANVNVKPLTSKIETGFALPDLADFEAAITPKTKAILICNPNNPTGAVYTEEKLRAIGGLAVKHDLFLFVDEVYSEFCYPDKEKDTRFFSALSMDRLAQHVAIVDSVSKRYSACGARIGTIVTQNQDIIAGITKYAQFRLSAPTMAQMFSEALLDVAPAYLREVKAEYERRRDALYSRLKAMDDVVCYKPGGAFYIFTALPIDDADVFCKWLLEDFDHKGETVMLAPGPGFYATEGMGKQQVRIAYMLNVEDLHKAMDCLEAALKVYPKRLDKATIRIKSSV